MTTFDEREKAFEAKFKLDQELLFKANVRRDKLLGLWAAEQMGMSGDAAQAYALAVVDAEFSEPDHDATHKVARDLAAHGVSVEERVLKREADRLLALAIEQLGGARVENAAAAPVSEKPVPEQAETSVPLSETIGQFMGKAKS